VLDRKLRFSVKPASAGRNTKHEIRNNIKKYKYPNDKNARLQGVSLCHWPRPYTSSFANIRDEARSILHEKCGLYFGIFINRRMYLRSFLKIISKMF